MPTVNLPAVFQTIASAAFSLILFLIPLLYPQVKAWVIAKAEQAKSKLSADQLRVAQQVAAIAVSAVEQLKKNGVILDNQHAFATALGIVQNWLASRGILLDMTLLRAAIESAVNELPHSPPAVAESLPPKRVEDFVAPPDLSVSAR